MAAIRDRNTKPELLVRSALHRAGFRFRLQRVDLPGKPDLVLPRFRAAIFVHGCFWHGHNCARFKLPGGENAAFWRDKIRKNRVRDHEVSRALALAGWRQLIIWECALAGPARVEMNEITDCVTRWLASSHNMGEISGVIRGNND